MRFQQNWRCLPVLTCCLVLGMVSAWAGDPIRRPVAAGPMYAAEPAALVASMDRLFEEADPPAALPGRLVACIVPHDPYGLSGRVAASAFKELTPTQFEKVLVLGACHANTIEGCSAASAVAYLTPLGPVPLAGKELSRVCRSSLVMARGLRYEHNDFLRAEVRAPLHETEHSIEVVLPFLQRKLGRYSLLPVLVGDLNESLPVVSSFGEPAANSNRANATVRAVGEAFRPILDDQTLIVVSTNFTHFGNEFAFRPAFPSGDIMGGIEALDLEAVRLIVAKDQAGFDEYLQRTGNPICGANALKLLLELLPANARGQLVDYDNSANKLKAVRDDGEVARSVSYAAINFYAPPVSQAAPDTGASFTFSQEGLEAWEAGRAAREAAEAQRSKALTLKLVGRQGTTTQDSEMWLKEGELPPSDAPTETVPEDSVESPAPQAEAESQAITFQLKGNRKTTPPGPASPTTGHEEPHE